MKKKKKMVVVLGMHRSGTSVLTRGLQVLGVNLGDRLMPPREGENDKGFWEDLDLITLNMEILDTLDSDWHFLTPIQRTDLELLRKDRYIFKALDILKSKTSNNQIFGFKDPRTAKLLPFWREVFAESGLDVCYVIVIRNPISVSISLAKRNKLDFEKSYILWLEHVLGSLIGTAGKKRILVNYDEFMQSPEIELAKVGRALQLSVNPSELEYFMTEFLDEKLRHTVHKAKDLLLDPAIPPLAREVYRDLLKASKPNNYLEGKVFKDKLDAWQNEFLRMRSAFLLVDNLTRTINSMRQEEQALITQMAKKDQQMAEKDQQITNRDIDIERLKAQIFEIYSSSSWRVTAPMRAVVAKLRELRGRKGTPVVNDTSNSDQV